MLTRATAALTLLLVIVGRSGAPDVIVGTALVTGPVFLNGHRVSASTLVTAGDRLETAPNASATLNISPRDRMRLGGGTAMILRTSPGSVWAEVEHGNVLVNTTHERLRELRLPDEAISIRATPGTARRYLLTRGKDVSYVLASAGNITIFDEGYGRSTEITEGMVGTINPEAEAPEPQAPQPSSTPTSAGKVTAVVPVGHIERGPARPPLNKGDAVLWNDSVVTERQGRARVVLDDGSILNVGSDSRLQVVQHSAKSQQTDLYLAAGRMRAQVVKMTRSNSSFQVRTDTAICGVLGTDFALEVDAAKTKLIVFKGKVSFRPIVGGVVAAVSAAVTVLAGQTSTAAAGAVSTPVSSGATSGTSAIASTTVGQQTATAATTVAVTAASASTAAAAAVISTATKPSEQDTGKPPFVSVSPARP